VRSCSPEVQAAASAALLAVAEERLAEAAAAAAAAAVAGGADGADGARKRKLVSLCTTYYIIYSTIIHCYVRDGAKKGKLVRFQTKVERRE
jgi:hypothetical protein